MTTNYHTALASTDDVNAETVNKILDQLGQQLSDMNDGTHAFSAIDIDGGNINSTPIGSNSAAYGTFTNLTVVGNLATGSAFMTGIRYGQYIGATSSATVAFNRVYLDTDNAYSLSTYRWTPVVAGYYVLVASVTLDVVVTGKRQTIDIRKNGAAQSESILDTKGTFGESLSTVTMAQANGTTDYFTVLFTNNGTGNNLVVGDDLKSFFGGFRVH